MKKILLILMLGIFLISFISSLDPELPQICGGDDELLIGCLGDEELIWLTGFLPPEGEISGAGEGAEYTTPEKEEPVEPEVPEEPEKKWLEKWWWVILLLCLIIFLMCRKKKCEDCKKKFRRKDLIKYKGKYYCKVCYEKANRNI